MSGWAAGVVALICDKPVYSVRRHSSHHNTITSSGTNAINSESMSAHRGGRHVSNISVSIGLPPTCICLLPLPHYHPHRPRDSTASGNIRNRDGSKQCGTSMLVLESPTLSHHVGC